FVFVSRGRHTMFSRDWSSDVCSSDLKDNREELYILMLISVAGAMLMVASSHYASFFISLELMSIPVYGLLAYTHQRSQSLEAGVKYLVLSATASAMLLMGMAYIYAYTGTLRS